MVDKINIVGLGPGAKEYIAPKAIETLENSHLVIGYERAIESINFIKSERKVILTLSEIKNLVENAQGTLSIVASGDPCFYGITNYIKNNFNVNIEVIPGISSFQYLMCKIAKPWNNGVLGSMHGRDQDFEKIVENNGLTIWLTDKANSPKALCERLLKLNEEYYVYVGENLSYEDEIIRQGRPDDLIKYEYSTLSIVVIERR